MYIYIHLYIYAYIYDIPMCEGMKERGNKKKKCNLNIGHHCFTL